MPVYEKENQRVLYAHIPKCGGSSMEWFLHRICLYNPSHHDGKGGVNNQHAVAKKHSTWGDFTYKFTIVRHPLERLISELNWKSNMGWELAWDKSSLPPSELCTEKFISRLFSATKKNPAVRGSGITVLDNHIRPQCDFISDDMEIFKYDPTGHEHIMEQWKEKGPITWPEKTWHGKVIEPKMPWAKLSQRKDNNRVTLKLMLDNPQSIKLIEDFYGCDYDKFGYDRI